MTPGIPFNFHEKIQWPNLSDKHWWWQVIQEN